jgi:branched-chain amino acid aminotransferase
MSTINYNGKLIEASDEFDNGAYRSGYGLFETMLVIDGSVQLKDLHWERLFTGATQMQLNTGCIKPAQLEEELQRLHIRCGSPQLAKIRLQLFEGASGGSSFAMECTRLEPREVMLNDEGLTIGFGTGIVKTRDAFANLKSTARVTYMLASKLAAQNRWHDCLIFNDEQTIIETSIANIFLIKGGDIYTPPLSDGCVAGVMRQHIIYRLAASGIAVQERSLTTDDLLEADELLLTNAIKRIKWVKSLGKKQYKNKAAKDIYNSIFLLHL